MLFLTRILTLGLVLAVTRAAGEHADNHAESLDESLDDYEVMFVLEYMRHAHRESFASGARNKGITELGQEEAFKKGQQRMHQFTKDTPLLAGTFNPNQVLFVSTDTQRTEETARKVFQGMFPFFKHTAKGELVKPSKFLYHPLKKTTYQSMIESSISQQTDSNQQCFASPVLRINKEFQSMHTNEFTCPRLRKHIVNDEFDSKAVQ